MTRINEQKDLLNFHREKVAEMTRVVEETTNKSELVTKFFIVFADIESASIAIKQNSLHLLVDRFRKFGK